MPRTILVVDDSATVRQLLELNLKKLPDVRVSQAIDGLDALEKLKVAKPSVLVTDINMPRMDGIALIEAVRKDDPTLPIVVVTTRGEEEDVTRGMKAGANAYVTKPINGAQLVETLRGLLPG